MKIYHPASASLISAALLLTVFAPVFSQKNNTWKGGTPGHEQDWNCPKNWSAYTVPDDFTNVFIPDVTSASLFPPAIKSGQLEVNALVLASKASLTIEQGAQLTVFAFSEGLVAERLKCYGTLLLLYEQNYESEVPASPLAGKLK